MTTRSAAITQARVPVALALLHSIARAGRILCAAGLPAGLIALSGCSSAIPTPADFHIEVIEGGYGMDGGQSILRLGPSSHGEYIEREAANTPARYIADSIAFTVSPTALHRVWSVFERQHLDTLTMLYRRPSEPQVSGGGYLKITVVAQNRRYIARASNTADLRMQRILDAVNRVAPPGRHLSWP